MSFHISSSHPPNIAKRPTHPRLRVAGVVLSLVSMILAFSGILFHPNVVSLLFAVLVCLFGLRVFVLWLGATYSPRPVIFNQPWQPSIVPASTMAPIMDTTTDSPVQNVFEQRSFVAPVASASPFEPYQTPYGMQPVQPYYQQPQPACGVQSAYGRNQAGSFAHDAMGAVETAGMGRTIQKPDVLVPYIPIEQDELFELDSPTGNEQCFLLSKEGELLVECQDRYALNAAQRCYAVADGVAGSFVPGPWARIIAKSFVDRGGFFADQNDFSAWLVNCCQQWHSWMEHRWTPTMNALRGRSGDMPGDWTNDIQQGAQTTLIGCSLVSQGAGASTMAHIFAIGDGEFFLFRPYANGRWHLLETFPFATPDEFGSHPDTLVTIPRADLVDRAWMQCKTCSVNTLPGDHIVLASDTLAQWLLTQVQQQRDGWEHFLSMTNPVEFAQRIRHEFHSNRIEDDDLTMLIIPVA